MTRLRRALMIVCLLVLPAYAQQEESHCHDPAVWADWNEKAAKWREDKEFQALHALRIGLYVKVEHGHLTVDEATAIFENARNTLIQKRREKRQEQETPSAS